MPLQWDRKNRQDREVAARLASVEQMRAEREDATRGHVAETLALLQEWQSNRHRLSRYDTTLITLAAERTRAALVAYRGGGTGRPCGHGTLMAWVPLRPCSKRVAPRSTPASIG